MPVQKLPTPGPSVVEFLERGIEAIGELGDDDQTRGDFERTTDEKLPDEQKRHQAAPAVATIRFQQVEIGAA